MNIILIQDIPIILNTYLIEFQDIIVMYAQNNLISKKFCTDFLIMLLLPINAFSQLLLIL